MNIPPSPLRVWAAQAQIDKSLSVRHLHLGRPAKYLYGNNERGFTLISGSFHTTLALFIIGTALWGPSNDRFADGKEVQLTHTNPDTLDGAQDECHRRGPVLIVAALTAFALALTGCNTTEGAGEDIQDAGSAIEDAAD